MKLYDFLIPGLASAVAFFGSHGWRFWEHTRLSNYLALSVTYLFGVFLMWGLRKSVKKR